MLMGLLLYIIGTVGFVGYGLDDLNYGIMLITYAVRGFGYPLFSYSFMVWITFSSTKKEQGSDVEWFWLVFKGGLNVFGAYYSRWEIKNMGLQNTMWCYDLKRVS